MFIVQLPVFYCLVMLEKTYHLGSQGSSFIASGKKKKKERLIFYNKYHKCSIFYHCIIHQGPFCSRLSHLPAMLAVHTQQAKFICESMLLPHCAFQVFLQELDATRHGVFLHDNVRCLRKEGELKCSSGWEYTPRGSCPNNNIHSQ